MAKTASSSIPEYNVCLQLERMIESSKLMNKEI